MTDSAAAWATVALASVALLTLAVAIWQAKLTRAAVAAALDDVAESRQARIDARSPRVIVSDKTDPLMPAAKRQSTVTGVRWPLAPGHRFDLPGSADQAVVLTAHVQLHNEGPTSAFLTLPPGGIAVPSPDDRPSDEGINTFRWAIGKRLEYRLAPGQTQWFLLEAGHSVGEWADLWHRFEGDITKSVDAEPVPGVRFVVEIRDQFAGTFLDTLTIDLLALPLQPLTGSDGSWQTRAFVGDPFKIVVETRVLGLLRAYGPIA